ncbi:hypothetical protein AB0L70_30820 [Kribbella sp. NPDC051952]|uniref:hypothetical protein n=1 Tax=Kribbella sp. NPDC051952 TaxID=3154851 RepID=UPI0034254284
MQKSILRSAAVLTSAVLAGAVITGISPAMAAQSSDCSATELKLPAGTPTNNTFASMSASDPTARYQVGHLQLPDVTFEPVFWTDGEPQVLEPLPGSRTSLIDVNSHGTVLGSTEDAEGAAQPWLYSHGTVRKLTGPAGMDYVSVRALNERGDVVGNGLDKATGVSSPIVWPAGGKPRRLLADNSSSAADISDNGVVVGSVSTEEIGLGMIWARWDRKGLPVRGEAGASVDLTEIRGNSFVGIQSFKDGHVGGGRWNTQSTKVVSYPNVVDGVNSSGDVAYSDETGTTVVVRPDGTQYPIDAVGFNTVRYLFERGQQYDAAGERDYGFSQAILWSGCAS